MPHKAIAIILCMLIVSACNQVATPLPLPSDTATTRPTSTISNEEMATAVSLRPLHTNPPTFTPTFTPSITPTSTITPSLTPSPTWTPIPEEILCEAFEVSYDNDPSIPEDEREDHVELFIPYDTVGIYVQISNLDTGELIDDGILPGNQTWNFIFSPADFTEVGNYEWVFSIIDATRNGMCERRGTFDTTEDEVLPTIFDTPLPSEAPATATDEALPATAAPEETAVATDLPASTSTDLPQPTVTPTPTPTTRAVQFPPR